MSETITEIKTNEEVKVALPKDGDTVDLGNSEVKPVETKTDSGLEKALTDLQKYKGKVRDLESAAETRRLDKLKEEERWQDLAKEWQDKSEADQKRAETLEQSMIFDKKYSAVRELAVKAGLRSEALRDLELIALDDVEIEVTSTGRVNVLNADKAVDRLKSSRPHWFGRRGSSINANDPEVVSGKEITYNDVLKAEELARKNGDYSTYKTMLMKYRDRIRS